MKRKVAFLLIVFALLSVLPGGGVQSSAVQQAKDDKQRDIVLVLDISGSMRGEPIRVLRESAVKFCEMTFESTSNTRIALITYNASITVRNQFTFSADDLVNTIEKLKDGGGTNINSALLKAAELLEKSDRPDAIKSIVLLSDGLPENGSTYRGADARYSKDIYGTYYDYASAVYNTAQTMQQYDIYTIGFFHSQTGQELILGQQLLKDIQNKGYFSVVDPEDLLIVFSDMSQAIIEGNYPIIVIPGILASKLYAGAGHLVWPVNENWEVFPLQVAQYFFDSGNELDVIKPVDLVPLEALSSSERQNSINEALTAREYGANDSFKKMIDRLCDEFPERQIYFFSYDFRMSTQTAAEKLETFIESLGVPRVELICHSMGGLVASQYVARNPQNANRINTVITLGTPFEGSPLYLYASTTAILDMYIKNNVLRDLAKVGVAMIKGADIIKSFTGGAELMPTEDYIRAFPFREKKLNLKWYGLMPYTEYDEEQVSYERYRDLCNKLFEATSVSYADIVQTQRLIKPSALGVLAALPNSYFVRGGGYPTISSLILADGFINKALSGNILNILDTVTVIADDIHFDNYGDGIVPAISSTMIWELENIPDAEERVIQLENCDHSGLTSDDMCLDWIVEKLNGRNLVLQEEMNPSTRRPYIVVRIACPVDVTVEKDGQILSSDTVQFSDRADFGSLYLLGENNEIKILLLDAEEFALTLNGTGEGMMDFDIRFFDGDNELTEERSFAEVPVTTTSMITTNTSQIEETILAVDQDGDGETDLVYHSDGSILDLRPIPEPEPEPEPEYVPEPEYEPEPEPIIPAETIVEEQEDEEPLPMIVETKSNMTYIIIIVCIMAVACLGVAAMFVVTRKRHNKDKSLPVQSSEIDSESAYDENGDISGGESGNDENDEAKG